MNKKQPRLLEYQMMTVNGRKPDTSQVNEFSTSLCVGRCKVWAHWKLPPLYALSYLGASILLFSIPCGAPLGEAAGMLACWLPVPACSLIWRALCPDSVLRTRAGHLRDRFLQLESLDQKICAF